MAESKGTVAVVPLSGANYATWRVQCQMALKKEGLWNIVTGEETAPGEGEANREKFIARKDRALAIVVLAIDPNLLYLIGEPDDPVKVWEKLQEQFMRKSWVNRLELRRKLYSLKLLEGESVLEHVRKMTELFNGLAAVGDPLSDEDRVVHLLASLPESYSVLVTALEASPEVPKIELVTERLLHEERKLRSSSNDQDIRALASRVRVTRGLKVRCYYCDEVGHFKRDCPKFAERFKQKSNSAVVGESKDEEALVAGQAVTSSTWIVDSGATCHMCNFRKQFVSYNKLVKPENVVIGDGRSLKAIGRGSVRLLMNLPDGTQLCKLRDVLHVPGLSYNLVSVSKASEVGKVTHFDKAGCWILNGEGRVIAKAVRCGSLYFLDCWSSDEVSVAEVKENIWHKRFGHLSAGGLRELAASRLVDGFDFDGGKDIELCEPCVKGKHHKSPFPVSSGMLAEEPLDLVHTDLCGKVNAKSIGGAEYFLVFVDDKTRYVWVYFLKRKDEVFSRFIEWKAMVEKSGSRKLKKLRSDNGGEFTSTRFQEYLKAEGVIHVLTIPKTPQQNGVAERFNCTLVEMTRCMLVGANLSHKLWAEALSTAAYLKNRSPARAITGMTPFEAYYGTKPSVNHL